MNDMNKEIWISAFIDRDEKKTLRKYLKRAELFGLSREWKILDLCCGYGSTLRALKKMGFTDVYGLDISEELVKLIDKNFRVQVGDCLRMGFKSNVFDAVVISGGIHHVPEIKQLKQLLKEIVRILKPNSWFIFLEPSNTILRKTVLMVAASPLSFFLEFIKPLKRGITLLQNEIYEQLLWLRNQRGFLNLLKKYNFEIVNNKKGAWKIVVRCKLKENSNAA